VKSTPKFIIIKEKAAILASKRKNFKAKNIQHHQAKESSKKKLNEDKKEQKPPKSKDSKIALFMKQKRKSRRSSIKPKKLNKNQNK
jgi:hypothetical protein